MIDPLPYATLADAAVGVLTTPDPAGKCALTRQIATAWQAGALVEVGTCQPPDRPARPDAPLLLAPRDMPKRSTGPGKGRIGLLHALAHIELNAVDLAWDIVARFPHEDLPRAFYDDWVQVAVEEAEHFDLLEATLRRYDSFYGALPAHDGLWQAAEKTAHDLAARLAVVPMTLEARGLDTTPPTVERLRAQGEDVVVAALEVIFADEIKHVAAGVRWMRLVASRRNTDPADLYAAMLKAHFPGGLKAPFNDSARTEAGFPAAWYTPLVKPVQDRAADGHAGAKEG